MKRKRERMTCYLRLINIILILLSFSSCRSASPERPAETSIHPVEQETISPRKTNSTESPPPTRPKLSLLRKRTLSSEPLDSFLVDRQNQILLIASGDSVKFFKLAEGFPYLSEKRLHLEGRRITSLGMDKHHLFLGLSDSTLLVSAKEEERSFPVLGFYRRINSILPLDENTLLVADCASAKTVDLSSRRITSEYKSFSYDICPLLLLDNDHFITGTGSGRIDVWSRTNTIKPLSSIKQHDGEVIHLERDGNTIFTFSRDGSVGVWNNNFEKVLFFIARSSPILSGALTPDGSRILVIYEDHYIALFSHKERKILLCEEINVKRPKSLITLDENNFAVLSEDGTASIFTIKEE
ncbi:MAG: hypothetical protein N2234_05105 [Planctomycetota bacterium]|nr:hypothetical protein [Planctomycetota bacterium]